MNKTVTVITAATKNGDTVASYNVYSNIDGLVGTMTVAEAAAGKILAFTDVAHNVTAKAVFTTAGESTLSSNVVVVDVAAVVIPQFTLTNITKNSDLDYESVDGQSYPAVFGVSTISFSGDFEFKTDIDNADTLGVMMGLSADGSGRGYNDGTTPWEYGAQINTSGLIRDIINGVLTDSATTVTNTAGDELRLVRSSNNLKLYYNTTEIKDFGTVTSSDLYLLISQTSASGRHIRTPEVL